MSGTDTSDSILIVLDVPSGVEFGIDCITYETGPKFKGLSLLPTGLHFVYHGTGMGARQGFFIMVGNKDIHVKRWDSSQEEILPRIDLSESSLRSLHHSLAIGELNEYLGPYPLQQHHTWKNITNFISLDVLDRADCSLCSLIYPGDDSDVLVLERTPAQTTRNKHGGHSSEAVKPYFPDSARIARFSDLQMIEMELIESLPPGPKRASTVTAMMMDKSTLVEHMINHIHQGSWSQFLGEIQLSFVLFMVLYSYPALKQWKLFVYSVCSSERLLQNNQPFTSAFLRMLFGQLNFAPADFFENELSTKNFLRPTITALFSALSGPGLNPTLLEHKKRLRTFLQKKFNLHETEPFESVDASTGMQVTYEEEDFYNIAEEDLPTFVSEEEVRSYLGNNDGVGGNGSTQSGRESNMKMAVDFGGMEDMRLDARDNAQSVFTVRTGSTGSHVAFQSDSQNNSEAEELSTTEGFHQRWANIDSALGQAPGGDKLSASSGLIGEDLLVERGAQGSHNYTFGKNAIESAPVQRVVEAPMTSSEQEAALFSWRYPLVYESMLLAQGREDMVMAAMRILEEGNVIASGVSASNTVGNIALGNTASSDVSSMRYKEAERFVEYELGMRSS